MSSESPSQRGLGRDALGLALMVLAVFGGVSVVMAMRDPQADAGGTTAIVMVLVSTFGGIACLFACVGFALIGVRLWVVGIDGKAARHLLGVLITTVTVSILVGTLSAELGGKLGDVVGGAVARRFSLFVGVPYGLAWVLIPAWFLWLRPTELSDRDESRTLPPSNPRSTDTEGVTAAEAQALLPRPTPKPRPLPNPEPRSNVETPAPRPTTVRAPALASPYPPDVRPLGGIPEGARPLEIPHARTQTQGSHSAATVQREPARPSADGPERRPDTNVAGAADATGLRRVGEPAAAPEHPSDRRPARPGTPPEREGAGFDDELEQDVSPARPLTLDAQAADAELDDAELDDAELDADAPGEPELDDAELDEDEFGADIFATTDAPGELEPELDGRPAAPSAQPFSSTPPAPSWEQPGLFGEEPVDAYGTPLALVESLRKAEEAQAADDAPASAPPGATAVHVKAPTLFGDEDELGAEHDAGHAPADGEQRFEVRTAISEPVVVPEPPDELDEDVAEEPADEYEEAAPVQPDEVHSAVVEPPPALDEVVLAPQPPATPAGRVKSLPRQLAVDETTYKAGCLFLERNRVAVSLLQKEFKLDFAAATKVLDELQRVGLIGPYLGGQRRDILMRLDEWKEKVGVA